MPRAIEQHAALANEAVQDPARPRKIWHRQPVQANGYQFPNSEKNQRSSHDWSHMHEPAAQGGPKELDAPRDNRKQKDKTEKQRVLTGLGFRWGFCECSVDRKRQYSSQRHRE